jgi:ribosomal RNA-processing protein 9
LRLAQRYLDNIREEVAEDPYAFDAADVDRDLIAERLKEDVAETKGKLHRLIAEEYDFTATERSFFGADQRGVTGVAVILPYAFTISGDGSIAKWELASPTPAEDKDKQPTNLTARKRPKLLKRFRPPRTPPKEYQGHTSQILCIAVPTSGRFLATGGSDRRLVIWDPATLRPIKAFTHHRDKILSLSFRRGTHTLYSASADRTCKVWSLDEMAGYVQTLFGHQDEVVGIAGGSGEIFVSVGGRDRTARLFKVVEEQQLVFRGGGGGGKDKRRDALALTDGGENVEVDTTKYEEGSIDCVTAVDEETFITGSDNGSLSLWSVQRKKPVFTVPLAHGTDEPLTLDEAYAEEASSGVLKDKERPGRRKPRWITAIATIPLADVVVTGSWDGWVRVWRVTKDRRRIEAVGVIGNESFLTTTALTNGSLTNGHFPPPPSSEGKAKPVKGVITSLALVERSEKTQVGTSTTATGLCVVASVSKKHRLGKWDVIPAGDVKGVKNGAVVFEVPRKMLGTNGEADRDEEVREE